MKKRTTEALLSKLQDDSETLQREASKAVRLLVLDVLSDETSLTRSAIIRSVQQRFGQHFSIAPVNVNAIAALSIDAFREAGWIHSDDQHLSLTEGTARLVQDWKKGAPPELESRLNSLFREDESLLRHGHPQTRFAR